MERAGEVNFRKDANKDQGGAAVRGEAVADFDVLARFEQWKAYPLPPMNSDGHFDKDWLHREFVAFKAGLISARAADAPSDLRHAQPASTEAQGEVPDLGNLAAQSEDSARLDAKCGCQACNPEMIGKWFFVCQKCGNKRCPHATDHALACTNSNEPGQVGSAYGPAAPQPQEQS